MRFGKQSWKTLHEGAFYQQRVLSNKKRWLACQAAGLFSRQPREPQTPVMWNKWLLCDLFPYHIIVYGNQNAVLGWNSLLSSTKMSFQVRPSRVFLPFSSCGILSQEHWTHLSLSQGDAQPGCPTHSWRVLDVGWMLFPYIYRGGGVRGNLHPLNIKARHGTQVSTLKNALPGAEWALSRFPNVPPSTGERLLWKIEKVHPTAFQALCAIFPFDYLPALSCDSESLQSLQGWKSRRINESGVNRGVYLTCVKCMKSTLWSSKELRARHEWMNQCFLLLVNFSLQRVHWNAFLCH